MENKNNLSNEIIKLNKYLQLYLFRLFDPFCGCGDGERLRFCLLDAAFTGFSPPSIGISSSTDNRNLCTFFPPRSSTS